MQLKFCGLRRAEDIAAANAYPPDYVGFVFAESRRRVTPEQARDLSAQLASNIKTVGVFVNEPIPRLLEIANTANLSVLQLHGDEDAAYIAQVRAQWNGVLWKAVRVQTAESLLSANALEVDALLLDAFSPLAYGGTGKTVDFDVIVCNRPTKPFFLAGGLHAGNLAHAIQLTHPQGVDISGGIETDGLKDAAKMQQLYELIRGAK